MMLVTWYLPQKQCVFLSNMSNHAFLSGGTGESPVNIWYKLNEWI